VFFGGILVGEFLIFLVGGGMISLGKFWLVSFGEKSWLSSSFSLFYFLYEKLRRVILIA